MKHIIILGDGMADEPIEALGGQTPMRYARTPYMDLLAREGVTGRMRTVPNGFHPGSEVANMAVLGYDLPTVYEGRGVLEAASIGVDLQPDEMAMRCNLVCVEGDILKNHSAGHITTEEADELIRFLNERLGSGRIRFYTGVSYRHLLVVKGGDKRVECVPPHDAPLRWVLGGVALFVVIGVFYVRMQLREKFPMLPFDLLKIPVFSMSVVTSILSFTAQMICMVAMPFLLVTTFHYDAVGTGLLMTSWPLVIVFVAPVAGILIGKIHPGILGGVGLMIMSIGCFSLSFVPPDTNHFGLVWRLMLCGMGFGLFQSPNNHMLLSSATPQRTGSASGMLATARLTGQTLGAALVALMFHLHGASAPHDAMLLAGILTLCGAVSSYSRLKVSLPR